MRGPVAICLAAVLAVPGAASAYTAKGIVECPKLLEEDANPEFRQMNKFWLLGYITARNYEADADAGAETDNEALYLLALDYCRANPEGDLDDAAIEVYDTLP